MKWTLTLLMVAVATTSPGENKPAGRCEIFIKSVMGAPSSHGSGSMRALVKVGWIGNGEFIKKVGFHGYSFATDLGNDPQRCGGWSPSWNDRNWRTIEPQLGSYYTKYGEYDFWFPVRSGTVLSNCPGFHYTWVGAFFVETDKHTYWLNPNLDPDEHFYFDVNGLRNVQSKGTALFISTHREDMRYYNPLVCRE